MDIQPPSEGMQVFVKTLSDDTITVDVAPTELVESLKNKIFDKEGIPAEHQLLQYADKDLEDGRQLNEYKVENHSTIHLNLRMVGGYLPKALADIAEKYVVRKMICKKCYGRLPARAKRCRKAKCGRTTNIRKKKGLINEWS